MALTYAGLQIHRQRSHICVCMHATEPTADQSWTQCLCKLRRHAPGISDSAHELLETILVCTFTLCGAIIRPALGATETLGGQLVQLVSLVGSLAQHNCWRRQLAAHDEQ